MGKQIHVAALPEKIWWEYQFMCGIISWATRTNAQNSVTSGPLANAINQLRHRGPDNQRLYLWRPDREQLVDSVDWNSPVSKGSLGQQRFQLGMAHSRLSIVDLSDNASQPMMSADRRYTLVFNGEIYNYIEVADQLRSKGIVLHTSSDSEVLLQALILWGKQAFSRLNGMWALTFFDSQTQQLIVSRDRFGKKPLYWFSDGQQLLFASEYKAIFAIIGEHRRSFNDSFMDEFLHNNWPTFADHASAYQGIYNVQPGSVMTIELRDLGIKTEPLETIQTCWDKCRRQKVNVAQTVDSAVRLRLRSDVPTAILLSGGVDSSIVAGFARLAESDVGEPIRWYTGNTNYGKDLPHAQEVARTLGVEMKTIEVADEVDFFSLLTEMCSQYEIPIRPNGNSVAMYQMYRAMSKDGIRVVLDGTGGDEVFGGYYNLYSKNVVASLISKGRLWSARRFIDDCRKHEHFDHVELQQHAIDCLKSKLLFKKNTPPHQSPLADAQLRDILSGGLPRWLLMNDQNSMAHSIEARSPLLDYRLLNFIRRPVKDKFRNGFNKWALRNALPSNISDNVRWRRDKQGFRYNPAYAIRNRNDDVIDLIRSSPYLKQRYPKLAVEASKTTALPIKLSLMSIAILEQANQSRSMSSQQSRIAA